MWGENRPAWVRWQGREYPVRVYAGHAHSLVPLTEAGERMRDRLVAVTGQGPKDYSIPVEDLSLRYVEGDDAVQAWWAALHDLQVERASASATPGGP